MLRPHIDKIEFKNIAHQDKYCKAVTGFTERGKVLLETIPVLLTNGPQELYTKSGLLHYPIKANYNIVKRHLDQLHKNNTKSSITEDYDIVHNLHTNKESFKNLMSPLASKVIASPSQISEENSTSKKSILKRVCSRVNINKPTRRYGDDILLDNSN